MEIGKIVKGTVTIDGVLHKAFEMFDNGPWKIVEGDLFSNKTVASRIQAKSGKEALEKWIQEKQGPTTEQVRSSVLSYLKVAVEGDDDDHHAPTEIQKLSDGEVLFFDIDAKGKKFRARIAAKDIHFSITTDGDQEYPAGYEKEMEGEPEEPANVRQSFGLPEGGIG